MSVRSPLCSMSCGALAITAIVGVILARLLARVVQWAADNKMLIVLVGLVFLLLLSWLLRDEPPSDGEAPGSDVGEIPPGGGAA